MNRQHPPRRILTAGASRLKRKEREPFYQAKPPAPVTGATKSSTKGAEPVSSNQLLAGYMAYEFLTKGTLLGQKFDPEKGEAEPSGAKLKPKSQSYGEVASLLKSEGAAHIPGVVNPTQLARWIQM